MAIKTPNGGTPGFEAELWKGADGAGANVDSAEHKHVVVGLILFKYIFDTFEERMPRLIAELREGMRESANLEKGIWKNLEGSSDGV